VNHKQNTYDMLVAGTPKANLQIIKIFQPFRDSAKAQAPNGRPEEHPQVSKNVILNQRNVR